MTVVFRVENDKGHGPYQSKNLTVAQQVVFSHMWDVHSSPATHPNPYVDSPLNNIFDDEFCAFESVEQMRAWFIGFARELELNGFSVVTYDIPERDIVRGRAQILIKFNREAKQKPLHTFKPTSVIP